MIVLDASALVELLLATPIGRRIAERIAPPEVSLHAPHLVDLEVAQTLRRFVRAGDVGERRAAIALDLLADLDLHRYPHQELLPRVWALRHNLTAYDAVYVCLAEVLDATLLTCDRRLAAAPPAAARAEVLGC